MHRASSLIPLRGFPVLIPFLLLAAQCTAFQSIPSTRSPVLPQLQLFRSLTPTALNMSGNDALSSAKSSETRPGSVLDTVIQLVGKTTSLVVSGVFFAALAWKRDALMVSFFFGSIANGILSKVLKKVINQTRPVELNEQRLMFKPNDGGMPSSHGMSLGFIGTFVALCAPLTAIPLLFYTLTSLVYRERTKLHTAEQLGVGFVLGTVNGVVWFQLCTNSKGWNVVDFMSRHFLDSTGHLPIPLLIIPMVVGAVTVGSLERRLSTLFKRKKDH